MNHSKGKLRAKVSRLRTQLTHARRNGVHPLEQRVNRLDRKIYWLWWVVGVSVAAAWATLLLGWN